MVEGEAKNMGKGVCVVCLNVWCNILGMMPHFLAPQQTLTDSSHMKLM